ncbi:MAG: iron chelate uptake ABC transporter family permease subunit [Actinomycetaceae bacterium]|nr:iron chelate uptake ABC transporter family permease subunit [Actinomycetaceae bacterium]
MTATLSPTCPAAHIDVGRVLRDRRSVHRKGILAAAAAALLACVLFVAWGVGAGWEVILPMRLTRLVGLVVVAVCLSCATVVFQAITRNRILSPSVMGFDALYSLVATALVFSLGSTIVNHIPAIAMFGIQAGVQTAGALVLLTVVLARTRSSVHLLVLVGIVIGTLLRSVTAMLSLIMDPNEFLAVADRQIASFALVNEGALAATVLVSLPVLFLLSRHAATWDVMALGPELATSLGLDYTRCARWGLAASAVLVACATALVGPLMFFGLLIANVTIFALSTTRTSTLFLAAPAIGIAVLVGGQWLLEHVAHQATVLPVILELVGGLVLLLMIVKESRR